MDNAILANAKLLDQIIADPEIFGHDLSSQKDEDDKMKDREHDAELDSCDPERTGLFSALLVPTYYFIEL